MEALQIGEGGPLAVFVTHGGPDVGGGHIGRCLALAGALRERGAGVRWVVNGASLPLLRQKGEANGATVLPDPFAAPEVTVGTLDDLHPSLCVVDSYAAGPDCLSVLRRCCPVLFLDDERTRSVERECDILLNYGLTAEHLGYEEGFARLLLGPGYALLRPEFRSLAPTEEGPVLLVPGAGDVTFASEFFLSVWREEWPEALLVVGPMVEAKRAERLLEDARRCPGIEALWNPPNLAALMARAAQVLCTASVTAYEALALRKRLIVFAAAPNQRDDGEAIERRGWGRSLGDWGGWGEAELAEAILRPFRPPPEGAVNPWGAHAAADAVLRFCDEARKGGGHH